MTAIPTHGIHHPRPGVRWVDPHPRVTCVKALCGYAPWQAPPPDLRLASTRALATELWRRYDPVWRFRVWRCNLMLAREGRPCGNPEDHR